MAQKTDAVMQKTAKKKAGLHFRADLVRESIRNNGLSQNKLADKLGVTPKTFSHKMNGLCEWTLTELQDLKKYLPDLDAREVFYL